jgi:hypothetical protein
MEWIRDGIFSTKQPIRLETAQVVVMFRSLLLFLFRIRELLSSQALGSFGPGILKRKADAEYPGGTGWDRYCWYGCCVVRGGHCRFGEINANVLMTSL